MGRSPCCDPATVKKGKWSEEEDKKLIDYINRYGCWNWRRLSKYAGLSRCGKSCRLRWLNYLSPDIKRGNFTKDEEETIVKMHESLGKRWSAIAAHLPGRTDNEIKNHWQTNLRKRLTPMTKSNSVAEHESYSLEQNKILIVDPKTPQAMEAIDDFSYATLANSNSLSQHKMTHRRDIKLEVHLLKRASASYILESSTLSSKPISIINIDALSAPAENLEDLPCNDIFAFLEAYNASASDSVLMTANSSDPSTGTIDTAGAETTEDFICDDIWAFLDACEISKESFTSLQQSSSSGLPSIAAKSRDSISSANMIDSASVTAEELQCDDVFAFLDAHNYTYE